jgi:hypothetical protein
MVQVPRWAGRREASGWVGWLVGDLSQRKSRGGVGEGEGEGARGEDGRAQGHLDKILPGVDS